MGQITVTKSSIEGLYVIEPTVHGDKRGYFMETYNLNIPGSGYQQSAIGYRQTRR